MYNHSRRIEVVINKNNETDCTLPNVISVLIFHKQAKLRSHALKHFCDTTQSGNWKKVLKLKGRQADIINSSINNLKNLGCPFFVIGSYNPPCILDKNRNCRLFNQCGNYVNDLEKLYFDHCKELIINGCHIPRVAHYFERKEKQTTLQTLHNSRITAIMKKNGDHFNLATCYSKYNSSDMKLKEVIDQRRRIIQKQSITPVEWINREEWGMEKIHHFDYPNYKKQEKEYEKNKRRKRSKRHRYN